VTLAIALKATALTAKAQPNRGTLMFRERLPDFLLITQLHTNSHLSPILVFPSVEAATGQNCSQIKKYAVTCFEFTAFASRTLERRERQQTAPA